MNVAVVDCGTNTFNLLIVSIENNTFKVISKRKRIVRLGKNLFAKNIFSDSAIEKAIETLKIFRSIIIKYNVEREFCVATSAVRDAENSHLLINSAKKICNFNIDVISGKREAELIYAGVCLTIPQADSTKMIMDIGGGSVEFIIFKNNENLWKQSFNIGGARLNQYMKFSDPTTSYEILQFNSFIQNNVIELSKAIEKFKPSRLIGASGSFETLANLILYNEGNKTYFVKNNFYQFNLQELKIVLDQLIASKYLERLKMPGMLRMRADMISIAALLVKFILETYSIKEVAISTYALKEGIIAENFINN